MLKKLKLWTNTQELIYFAFLSSILALLALDSFNSADSVQNIIGIASKNLVLPTILLQLIIRWQNKIRVKKKLNLLYLAGLIFIAPIWFGLSLYGKGKHPSTVFSLTHLQLPQIGILLTYLILTLLIQQSKKWWQKNWQKVILLTPLVTYILLYAASTWPFDYFKQIVKEDHIIENLQFWVLAAGALWNSKKIWQAIKNKKYWIAGFFLIWVLGFAFIAGDEISWGQRVLDLKVSESYKQINRQEELTIHNLYAIEWLVIYAYVGLSLFGVMAKPLTQLLSKKIPSLEKFTDFLPQKIVLGFFLFSLIYFGQQLRIMWGIWHSWSEVAELYLYSGLVLWISLISP